MYVTFNKITSYTIIMMQLVSALLQLTRFSLMLMDKIHKQSWSKIPFDFPPNTWFTVNHLIDMDRDIVEFSIRSSNLNGIFLRQLIL